MWYLQVPCLHISLYLCIILKSIDARQSDCCITLLLLMSGADIIITTTTTYTNMLAKEGQEIQSWRRHEPASAPALANLSTPATSISLLFPIHNHPPASRFARNGTQSILSRVPLLEIAQSIISWGDMFQIRPWLSSNNVTSLLRGKEDQEEEQDWSPEAN